MTGNGAKTNLWGSKRYHNLNYHLRQKFGEKVFKIPVDAGLTCPNRDGTLSRHGCFFCSARGSGDFAGDRNKSIEEQFKQVKKIMHKKWHHGKYIAYFQAFTNTYGSAPELKKMYEIALAQPDVVGLAIATRPDCLESDIVDVLADINKKTYLWVELGLQTIHSETSRAMNLHYDIKDFVSGLKSLRDRNIEVCTHLILGLPGESRDDMYASAQFVARSDVQGLKLHMLHLMKNTPLEKIYENYKFAFLSRDEYVQMVVDILEIMPPGIVIHRLTGDSPRDLLIQPKWTLKKWEVLNQIDKSLQERETWQGKKL